MTATAMTSCNRATTIGRMLALYHSAGGTCFRFSRWNAFRRPLDLLIQGEMEVFGSGRHPLTTQWNRIVINLSPGTMALDLAPLHPFTERGYAQLAYMMANDRLAQGLPVED